MAAGRIAAIETGVAARPGDSRHGVALPGLPNLHSHAFQRAMAGLAEAPGGAGRDDFWSWRETMYRLVGRLTPEDVAAVTAMALCEMLEAGFTRVGEFHYLHHDVDGRAYAEPARMAAAMAEASAETGIALTLLPVFYAHAGFGSVAPTQGATPVRKRSRRLREAARRLRRGAFRRSTARSSASLRIRCAR